MTLKIVLDRMVQPKEITSLIYGTGALGYEWWNDVQWRRYTDGGNTSERLSLRDHDIDEAQEGDYFLFVVDDPDEPEGSGKTRKVLVTMAQMAEAAGKAIAAGHLYEPDALREDLGYADAPQADCVMQWAAFGEVVYG